MAFGGNVKRIRSELREQLTPAERAFWYGMVVVVVLLPPLTMVLLVFGDGGVRAVGVGLLVAALVLFAVPVAPILRARVRRREARGNANE